MPESERLSRVAVGRPVASLAARAPRRARRALKRVLLGPRWGDFRRTSPFSADYGFDRGTPIDRVYIEQFLGHHSHDIRGEVLEVKNARYTARFGGDKVSTSHVLDLDESNRLATIVADLAGRGSLPPETFDCFILTQTLQLVPDVTAALANACQSLAPGGVLLVTVPTVTMAVPELAPDRDYWRYTSGGLRELLRRAAGGAEIEVEGRGNLLAAVAFLMGLAAEELTEDELGFYDPRYELVACGRIRKA
jgi:hypothetical protein